MVLNAARQRTAVRRTWPDGLTAREVNVLGLLARGRTNRQIAERLTLAPKTVANHIEHVYTKIGVTSRAAATLYAAQHGLVGAFEADSRTATESPDRVGSSRAPAVARPGLLTQALTLRGRHPRARLSRWV